MKKYSFIGKSLFFEKERIVVFGDLHLGYEENLRLHGLEIHINKFKEMKEEVKNTLKFIKTTLGKIEKIIFLGDVKHSFGFIAYEKKYINELIKISKDYLENENRIIFIRGNHEKNEKNEKFLDFYVEKDIVFIHGNKEFLEMYDKKINLVIMGHVHPTIILKDKMKIKGEKYKCFLTGRHIGKDFIVVPSFLSITEGISSTEFSDEERDFSVIPTKELKNFEVFVCQELGEKALDFGKLGAL